MVGKTGMEGVASKVKNFFHWATETDVIFAVVLATFLLAFLILTILLRRGGRSTETKAVLDAIAAARSQLGDVDKRMEQDHRFHRNWMLKLLARFGFMDAAAQDAVKDIKKRPRDDDDTH